MHAHTQGLARMPTDKVELAVHDPGFAITKAYTAVLIARQVSFAGGLGACYAPNGEREGQRPLASRQQDSGEREGQRPLASTGSQVTFGIYRAKGNHRA
jgi:hypothetical protein